MLHRLLDFIRGRMEVSVADPYSEPFSCTKNAVSCKDRQHSDANIGRRGNVTKTHRKLGNKAKARAFVHAVIDLHNSLAVNDNNSTDSATLKAGISTLASEKSIKLAKRMYDKQDRMKATNNCIVVDLGYHYTRYENMSSIRAAGLLSLQERSKQKIKSIHNGSSFGDGIYTCDDPITHRNSYGPVCLLVARLHGKATYVRDKIVVLRSSRYCVPLAEFLVEPNDQLLEYHAKLQSIIDVHFNGGAATVLQFYKQQDD